MKQLLTIIVFAMILTACGAGTGGSAKIDIKVGGKDVSLETKTSGTYKNVKTFTDINGKATTATTFQVGLANYEMDPATPLTMSKPLTSPDQVRLMIQLVGEEGTERDVRHGSIMPHTRGMTRKLPRHLTWLEAFVAAVARASPPASSGPSCRRSSASVRIISS